MRLLSGIGLGTFPLASPFTPVTKATATEIIRTYLSLGGKYIDVAPTYAFGEIESLVGETIKDLPRDSFFINTSCGYVLDEKGQFQVSGKYHDVIADCDDSLGRLGLDYLDLYISHVPDPNTSFAETVSAMEELKKQGKIRRIGVSNVTLDQLCTYNQSGAIEYVQNRFSLLNRSFDPEFTSYCETEGIGIIAYQAIDRGLLTEKVVSGLVLRDGDLRLKKAEFSPEVQMVIGRWVGEYLLPIAHELEVPLPALAIWWALQQPAIALCQIGATNTEYLRRNMEAVALTPPSNTLNRIEEAYKELVDIVRENHQQSIREFMGLAQYNIYSGSASGKTT